jgi:hypothetical protein
MSDGITSSVGMATGPTHLGQGDQFNVTITPEDIRRLVATARNRRVAAKEDLARLLRRFVPPENYGLATARVEDNGCVLLAGQSGSGRHAAATMLLYQLPGPYVPIQEVSLDPDESGDPLDGSHIQPEDRLLLDVSLADDALLPRLSSRRAEARERGAHLVVVLNIGQHRDVPSELAPLVVRIERPDGLHVLRRHLSDDGVPCTTEQLTVPSLAPYLAAAPIRVLADLAHWILAARDRAAQGSVFADWLASALATLSDQDGKVAKELVRLGDGRLRALLLACAMLSNATSDAVHDATVRLLNAIGHPLDDRPALDQPSIAEQFSEIGVRTDSAGRVRFEQLDYDRAVRTHFWTNYPGLRGNLRTWVGEVAPLPVLGDRQRDDVVDRFAEQALRLDRPDDLIRLVRQWSSRAGSLEQAARSLECGLGHARHGGVFRRQIYQWAIDRQSPPGLVGVLVRTCANVLVLTHPDEALVRLHHLARRQGAVAWDVLLDLVHDDDMLFLRLLARLADILARGNPWQADGRFFLDLAEPEHLTTGTRPLIARAAVRVDLVLGWFAVLGRPSELWDERVRGWLNSCAAKDCRDWLLDVLVEAANGRAAVFSRLYVVARDWAREPFADRAARIEIADLLSARIDSAQGIEETR